MPTYDYKCPDCKMTMTVIRTLKEEERIPICVNDAKELVRDYSSPVVKFKGTGFYKNDK
jgi:putative FmdB family regulatory protein